MTKLTRATQFERIRKLDELLRQAGRHAKRYLATELEVSEKTVQRDLEFLRDRLEAPLEYDREENGYYYTSRDWRLPLFNMAENELLAYLLVASALTISGGKSAEKMARSIKGFADDLAKSFSVDTEVLRQQFSLRLPPARQIDPSIFSELVLALLHRCSIRVTYSSTHTNNPATLHIDPYHIANIRGEWYLYAFCHRAKAVHQYAVARIKTLDRTEEHFELPSDSGIQERIKNGFGGYARGGGKDYDIHLIFDASVADRIQEYTWQSEQKTCTLPDGRVDVQFVSSGLEGVKRWLLAWGHQVEIVSPPALRSMVTSEIRRMMARYAVPVKEPK